MTERPVLILTPADMPAGIPGAIQIDAGCGHRAWISPTGVMALVAQSMATSCWDCLDPNADADVLQVPGARAELATAMGDPEWADNVVAQVTADPKRAVEQLQRQSRRARRSQP